MKKSTIVLFCLLAVLGVSAQEFQGKAEYFSKTIIKQKVKNSDSKIEKDVEFDKMIQEALKKSSEKKYLFIFNKQEGLYEQMEELEKPEVGNATMSIKVTFSGVGKKYINLKDKSKVVEDEIFGKEFLIVDTLEKLNWILVNETKKIGDYSCYKAEVTVPVTEKQKQEYQDFLKKQENKISLFPMEEPKDKVITAWYAPEIPVSLGPLNYWGLPGLILEINEEDVIILCSKVTLSNKEVAKIKVPNTSKKVTQAEFDAIEKAKLDSMKDKDGNVIFQTSH
ncbi:GLPGLI family protein [Flavobacterium yafengii]|uniref:GLPGLI family protein n=1 Tax=Flavobacterium yafengii TaxID=3041253 RepID=A0AAW6TKE3_9FLAO|nr:GLPGLI family protein [Flavobacterium yafengii]MDI5948073.1 GLPGLI family protein [Flavobacterium yafengii]